MLLIKEGHNKGLGVRAGRCGCVRDTRGVRMELGDGEQGDRLDAGQVCQSVVLRKEGPFNSSVAEDPSNLHRLNWNSSVYI